jgi:hypothetical protein
MLGTVATNAIQDVLGWQIRRTPDPNGFLNALKQSFSLKIFEGYVQSTWTQHTHVAQNDVAGGLAGAQASIYAMTNTILAQALPLIENLAPLIRNISPCLSRPRRASSARWWRNSAI